MYEKRSRAVRSATQRGRQGLLRGRRHLQGLGVQCRAVGCWVKSEPNEGVGDRAEVRYFINRVGASGATASLCRSTTRRGSWLRTWRRWRQRSWWFLLTRQRRSEDVAKVFSLIDYEEYRVTHHIVQNLPLTSKKKSSALAWPGQGRQSQNGTFL